MAATVPTLERISLIKVVTLLWNEKGIHRHLSRTLEKSPWKEIKRLISGRVDKLQIPSSLKIRIPGFIEPIGTEIYLWLHYHVGQVAKNYPLKMPFEFSWTVHGTIDSRKTAKNLVTNEGIDPNIRYFWACYYSLKREISSLWRKLNKSDSLKLAERIVSDTIVIFWTFRMDRDLNWLPSEIPIECKAYFHLYSNPLFVINDFVYRNRIQLSFPISVSDPFIRERHRYSVAAEYFWLRLTAEEKQLFSSHFTVRPEYQSHDVIHFIFTRLDLENQNRVLSDFHEDVLVCFLKWPRHTHFLEVARRSRNFLTGFSFQRLLRFILCKIRVGIEGYNELFEEFWDESPESCKLFVVEKLTDDFVVDLCALKNRRKVLSILNYANVEGGQSFHFRVLLICIRLVQNCLFDLLEDFVTEKAYLLPFMESALNMMIDFAETLTPSISAIRPSVDMGHLTRQQSKLKQALLVLSSVKEERKRNRDDEHPNDSGFKRHCLER